MNYQTLVIVLLVLALPACGFSVEKSEQYSNQTSTPTNLTDDYNKAEIQELAESWVMQAPTYAYDGANLDLQEHNVLESYPVQHKLTYTFTSSSAGYGNRSDEMTAQVLTDHTIIVWVQNNEVTSAIIDMMWDETTQESMSYPVPTTWTTLQFTPEQCEEYVWDEWYVQGNINYIQEPTKEQLITDYYASQGVELTVTRQESDMMTCQACGCAHTYSYVAEVKSSDADILVADNWSN